MKNRLLAPLAMLLALVAPAVALEIKSDTRPGAVPPPMAPGETGINLADGRFFYRDEAGNRVGGLLPDLDASGYLKFRNGMVLGRFQNGKFSALGDISGTVLALGTYPQELAERARDQARSVMDEVPPALRLAARIGMPVVDYAPYIQAILDTGRDVYLPPGRYNIRKPLRKTRPGQRLVGAGTSTNNTSVGSYGSTLVFDTIPSDNPTAFMTETLHSVTTGIAFDFVQPAAGTGTGASGTVTRADLKRYPWAIDVSDAPGAYLDDIGIFSAWNGIKAIGNAGGVRLGKVDIGAFNIGTMWDGPLHAVHWNHVDCWPYGFSARSDLMAIYLDGTTIGAQVGRIDEWVVDSLTLFGVRFLYAGQNRGVPGQIANLGLDGKGGLEAATGSLSIANMYGTTASPNDSKLTNNGATVLVGNVQFASAVTNTTPLVKNNSGRTVIQGGESITDRLSTDMTVSGGILEVSNIRFGGKGNGNAFPIAAPAISQSGSGILVASSNSLETPVTTTTPPTFIKIGVDGPHRVMGNDFAGATLALSGPAIFGIYTGNVRVANRGRLPNGLHIGVRRTYTFDFALDANGYGQAAHSIVNPRGLIRSMSASYEPGSGSPISTSDAMPLPVQVGTSLVKVNGGPVAANGFAHVIIEIAE